MADLQIARRVLSAEADALNQMAESLSDEFIAAVDLCVSATGRIICAGVGKSGHVARKIAATMASTGAPSQFVHPTEASHGDLGMITSGDVVLALSRSGETSELSDLLLYCQRFSIPLIGMTAKSDSALGRASDCTLLVPDIPEACLVTKAPTTSTTLMMSLGDALAVALLERRGFQAEDFKTFHPGGKLGSMLKKVSEIMVRGSDVPFVQAGSSFQVAVQELTEKNVGCVGVLSSTDQLVGVLTDGDIRRVVLSGSVCNVVDDAMTRNPKTVTPNSPAYAAISTMNELNIMQLFVVEDDRCQGVLHMHDVLRAGVV